MYSVDIGRIQAESKHFWNLKRNIKLESDHDIKKEF